MTIHSDHPFLPPESERSPIRRARGRLTSGVTLWTTTHQGRPAGLTVSSMMVADGDPGGVVALLDPDSDLWEAAAESRTLAVTYLRYDDRKLADAFAGLAPAPGGPFKMTSWTETEWGPVLPGERTWMGCRLIDEEPRTFGWGVLVEAVAERIDLGDDDSAALAHRRGRYLSVD